MGRSFSRVTVCVAGLSVGSMPGMMAQGRGFDVSYGRWLPASGAIVYSAAYYRPVIGPIDYGLGFMHVQDLSAAENRSLTGGEVSVGLGRDGTGPYLVGAAGVGLRHMDRNPDVHWSAGGGYSVQVFSVLSLGLEARYRVEDRRTRGFWRLDPLDRRGVMLQGRVAVALGSRSGGGQGGTFVPARARAVRLSTAAVASMGGADRVRDVVVQTAIDAMGTPYRWGGTDENGFDCSGLIQFAYQEHGVILPRHSRAQARTGVNIERDPSLLVRGDILGFSLDGSGVSHVGLYVGDGQFIHSSSSGVRLSTLAGSDPEGQYWLDRWASVSRVVN